MTVAVAVTMTVAVTLAVLGIRIAERNPDRLIKHVDADPRDDQKAEGAHAGDVGEPDPKSGTDHHVGQPHNNDRRDHVNDGDLRRDCEAACNLQIPPHKIGDDHELAVAWAEGVDHAVSKSDAQTDEEGG